MDVYWKKRVHRKGNPRSCAQLLTFYLASTDLPAFLLKGMQRLLKYQPLLSQVRKYTMESDTTQCAELGLAMKLLNATAGQVNEMVRASENARRLVDLSRRLKADETAASWLGKPIVSLDLMDSPNRQLIMEGTLKYIRSA